ncbi:MAG TPA: peptidoglycan-binding protein, partial [Methylocella sp.]|nr:peptidoglycan-binding protein [Methylocella sp.]
MREALATADHDFVLSEPVSKLERLRQSVLTARRHGLGRATPQGRRYMGVVASGFFVVAVAAILLNALAWQRTRHPAPLFARAAPSMPGRELKIGEMTAAPAPRSQPAAIPPQARDKPIDKSLSQKPSPEKPAPEAAADGGHPHQTSSATPPVHDQISELLKAAPIRATPAPKANVPSPSRTATAKASPAASRNSVLAAQRALVKLGFVLNPDGVAGKTTRQAIESYERDHKLPVRGELTPSLARRLSAEAGIAEGTEPP